MCLTVFVNSLFKQLAIFLGVVVILLLNVMEVFCWIDRVWSSKEYVFDISVHLRCSFHKFCLCVCMSEVISSFRSSRVGSHVFALLMLFLCVILHTMCSGKSLQLLCIFTLWYIVFVCHQNHVCEDDIASVYFGGYCDLREIELCVFGKLCPVGFHVVCECSFFLQSVVMSFVDCGDDW